MSSPISLNTHPAVSSEALLASALNASNRGDSPAATQILQTLLATHPEHAQAHHLLGAQYAQTGRVDDALSEFSLAIQFDPSLVIARFQLGTLLLTCGRLQDAVHAWTPLDELGPSHVLNLFKLGMQHLVLGRLGPARQSLEAARVNTIAMPFLADDIDAVLNKLNEIESQASVQTTVASLSEGATEEPDQHVLLNIYQQSHHLH
jgi:Flp pilus assembly protein TadD